MKTLLISLAVLVVVFFGIYFGMKLWGNNNSTSPAATTTPTSDVAPIDMTGWKTTNDTSNNTSFEYPPSLSTTYITPVDWPPKVQLMNSAFTCNPAGSATSTAGQTVARTINGTPFCVTTETEGAAGSIYYTYAYAFAKDGKTAILNFSLRYPQCANYDEPKRSACSTEENSFNVDTLISNIARTLSLSGSEVQAS